MMKEPNFHDLVYKELRECEDYQLMNLVTYEAAIRNPKVKEIIDELDSKNADELYDIYKDEHPQLKVLRENYYFNYDDYRQKFKDNYLELKKKYDRVLKCYIKAKNHIHPKEKLIASLEKKMKNLVKMDNYIIHTKRGHSKKNRYRKDTSNIESFFRRHKTQNQNKQKQKLIEAIRKKIKNSLKEYNYENVNESEHNHSVELHLLRPKMKTPQKESYMEINIPIYNIHSDDIKNYIDVVNNNTNEIIKEISTYYKERELFYDINEAHMQQKRVLYAEMFFAWDYIAWYDNEVIKSKKSKKSKKTRRTLHAEIAQMIGKKKAINKKTGRVSIIEDYFGKIKKLIKNCEYKKYYEINKE